MRCDVAGTEEDWERIDALNSEQKDALCEKIAQRFGRLVVFDEAEGCFWWQALPEDAPVSLTGWDVVPAHVVIKCLLI